MKKLLTVALILLAVPSVPAAITAGQNLLTNGSAAADLTTGWTVTASGGNGWSRTASGGYDSEGGYFITSFGLCARSQTIDLLATGATAAELDAAPPIRVSEAISMNNNKAVADTYYLRVELRDAAGGVIARWDAGTSTARKTATTAWVEEQHEFHGYGPGVRYVYFEDGGIDAGYWAGAYGTWHDAATVAFMNLPPADLTLTPAAVPANVPPGGIAGQLRAADPDSLTHTFSLEAETGGSTQVLLEAAAPDWRYSDTGVLPAVNWMAPDFDDSAWAAGRAPLGYDSGNADTWFNTKISYGATATAKPVTAWFRKTFQVNDPAAITALSATLLADDGCVVYLNGQELFRDGMPAGDITSDTVASRSTSGADESDYDPVTIPAEKLALLVPGTNVIAVEVHQDKITSSDLGIDLTLTAAMAGTENRYDNDLFFIAGSGLHLTGGSASLAPRPHTVRVQARDAAGNVFVKRLTVEPSAAVSSAAPAAFTLTPGTVAENAPAGTLIGSFAVSDADAGDAHYYELTGGEGDTGNRFVTISDNRLFVLESPDFETTGALSLNVRVTDSAGLSLTRQLLLAITDDTAEDSDADGLTEAEEDPNNNGILEDGESDPLIADTDGDTFNDRDERTGGSDPRDPASVPAMLELRQIATHATGDSWLTAASWQGGVEPGAIHMTVTDNLTLRPPPLPDPVFPGVGADLRNGAVFRLKHTGLAAVPRIILRQSTIQHGMTERIGLGGPGATLEVPEAGVIDVTGQALDLTASLSGAGTIRVIGTAAGQLRLQSPASGFTGALSLENPEVILTDAAVSGARRIMLAGGVLRTEAETLLPHTVLQRTGTGKLALSHTVTAGAFTAGGISVPPGAYAGTDLLALGIPAAAIEDNGGSLIITGLPALTDTDGDGASDFLEILSKTNPEVPGDGLRLNPPEEVSAGTFRLQWNAVPGVTYTIQTATGLNGAWQDLAVVTPVTSLASRDLVFPAPRAGSRFFRLAVK